MRWCYGRSVCGFSRHPSDQTRPVIGTHHVWPEPLSFIHHAAPAHLPPGPLRSAAAKSCDSPLGFKALVIVVNLTGWKLNLNARKRYDSQLSRGLKLPSTPRILPLPGRSILQNFVPVHFSNRHRASVLVSVEYFRPFRRASQVSGVFNPLSRKILLQEVFREESILGILRN